MRVLFVTTQNLIAAHIAYRLVGEGCEVKLCITGRGFRESFDGLVPKVNNWHRELSWVGKTGLIVFDDTGFGNHADRLRTKGYRVCGGSAFGDRLEMDRLFAQKLFQHVGMTTVVSRDFRSIPAAIRFIKRNCRPWVIKQNDHSSAFLTYVGTRRDGSDVVDVLENYHQNHPHECRVLSLQERIDGVEFGVARYFNGVNWVGPIELNQEYKKLFPGDLGEVTSEMGTLAWYDPNEENKIFQQTLNRLTPYLRKVQYKGDVDINCIVNERGAFPLEATTRFGSPIVHLQAELHLSPWREFLSAIADGEDYQLEYKRGFGIVVLLAAPPFPYRKRLQNVSLAGLRIDLGGKQLDQIKHLTFENVRLKPIKGGPGLFIAQGWGYVMYITGTGRSVADARKNTYRMVDSVSFPKMFYRNDIGVRFIDRDKQLLQKWGYL